MDNLRSHFQFIASPSAAEDSPDSSSSKVKLTYFCFYQWKKMLFTLKFEMLNLKRDKWMFILHKTSKVRILGFTISLCNRQMLPSIILGSIVGYETKRRTCFQIKPSLKTYLFVLKFALARWHLTYLQNSM